MKRHKTTRCAQCKGTGWHPMGKCFACDGKGVMNKKDKIRQAYYQVKRGK